MYGACVHSGHKVHKFRLGAGVVLSGVDQQWLLQCGTEVSPEGSSVAGSRPSCGSAEEQQDWDLSQFLSYHIAKVLLSIIKLMHLNLWAVLCSRLFFKQFPFNSLETIEQVLLNMRFIFISKYLLFLSLSLLPVYNKENFKGIYCDFS